MRNSKEINIILLLWGLVFVVISVFFTEYVRYFYYLSILIFIPIMILNMIKQRKEDKLNGTTIFKASIYRMLIMAAVLLAFFFITKQNHI
ncbi:hypothetical protein IRZ71_05090 [Flavobacterium sp. ANB]|uniref:hypothetical protein n=1 Tax=unclassified Flavobacterium TaxID=196869 RepID=UPI0012B9C2A7|nr:MULTISPECIES: hypothetical protein [unclassified Flavobacterium]MBF4515703.1 hypothetical protein [Flavobacterium sp. ANB]MTD68706.1 hypothetical protein [Flavobacterium sp. LC2016-13]